MWVRLQSALPMADTRTLLDIQPRDERGSRANRRLRRAGLVPGVVYGGSDEAEAFKQRLTSPDAQAAFMAFLSRKR